MAANTDPYGACTGNCDECNGAGACRADSGKCTGNCDVCNGSGTSYSCAADSTKCTGDCVTCSGSGTSYSCAAVQGDCAACKNCSGSGTAFSCVNAPDGAGDTSGTTCNSSTTFCCGGACVNAGAEYGAACGSGDCAGGTWGCSGTSQRCSSYGNGCDYCYTSNNYDYWVDATCTSSYGTSCSGLTLESCAACTSCKDNGATISCVATGGTNSYGYGTEDPNNPNTCTGTKSCNGAGLCLKDNGEACTADSQCTSNNCRKEIDSANKYCAETSRDCSEGKAGHAGYYTYDVGTNSNAKWLCKGTDDSIDCTSSRACHEYAYHYCDGAGTWNWWNSEGQDANCPTCKVCGGNGDYNEGATPSCDTNVAANVADPNECKDSAGCEASGTGACVCDGAGNCDIKNGFACTSDAQCVSGLCTAENICCTGDSPDLTAGTACGGGNLYYQAEDLQSNRVTTANFGDSATHWYKFWIEEWVDDCRYTSSDDFHTAIGFDSNPGDAYRFEVRVKRYDAGDSCGSYQTDCPDTGDTKYTTSVTCPCGNIDGKPHCLDDSLYLYLRVFRKAGAAATCSPYSLRISTGACDAGNPCPGNMTCTSGVCN